MTEPLKLSQRQQSALAELCTLAAAVKHRINTAGEYPSPAMAETLGEIVERFDSINWGELYDRLHRSGANSHV